MGISHKLPHTARRIVSLSIAINPFSRGSDSPFQALNCSNSRYFGTKSVVFLSIAAPIKKPCFSVEFVDRYHVKLGVEELGVGEWSEVRSGGAGSGGVSGSGRFSGCSATDSAVHKSLLPTPLSFHCCHTAL